MAKSLNLNMTTSMQTANQNKNAEYNENMKAKAGISPEEFIPKFNEELVAAQSPFSN